MPHYGEKKYWEEHYKNIESNTFDWLEDYSALKEIISSLKLKKDSCKILNVGCGNSEFSENMYDDGYHNIYNIDISQAVINLMINRSKNRIGMTYEVMDVFDIKYENNLFDLIIDKGTLDAISCGYDHFINIAKMIKEIQRVLKIGGYYMIVSYEIPDERMIHLNRKFLKFKVDIVKIGQKIVEGKNNDFHYVYLCKKLEGADETSKKYFHETIQELIEQEEIEEEQDEIHEGK